MAEAGTTVENSNATTDVPTNFEICDRTGFRVRPHELRKDGYGMMVRPESHEYRHPQEFVRSTTDKQTGSIRPEGADRFLADGEVTASDL